MLAAYDGGGAGDRIEQALDTVELTGRAGDRVGGYSHGMRQRLGIAAALLRDPKLLLLDEPATGLDPAGMRDMRLLIHALAGQGMTVLLSSHLLTEVEDVCNRVAIVSSGRIVYEGEIATLKRGAGTSYRLQTTDDERALAVCRAQPGIAEVHTEAGRISFTADEAAAALLSQALVEAGALIKAMAPQTVTLEDLFFSFTEGDGTQPAPAPAAAASAAQAAP
jgi:ABC-2 type transport system ATP-binding protein